MWQFTLSATQANTEAIRVARVVTGRDKVLMLEVLTDDAYASTARLGAKLADGMAASVRAAGLPWHIHRLGPRVGYTFRPEPVRNATEGRACADDLLGATDARVAREPRGLGGDRGGRSRGAGPRDGRRCGCLPGGVGRAAAAPRALSAGQFMISRLRTSAQRVNTPW